MSASQIGQNGRGKLIAVDKATEENCRSCDPDHDRKIHNGECPCCEVIFKFFMGPISPVHLIFLVLKSGSFKVRLIISLLNSDVIYLKRCARCLKQNYDDCCHCLPGNPYIRYNFSYSPVIALVVFIITVFKVKYS